MSDTLPIIAKELSWLSFNERVLQEAADSSVPVIQRLRYLGIFSNNLDEFFRVRVADVSRLAEFSNKKEEKEKYNDLLQQIQTQTLSLQKKFDKIYMQVLATLRQRKIYLINEQQLDSHQAKEVETLFEEQVLPQLDPILIDPNHSFPKLLDGVIYLAIKMQSGDQVFYGIVDIPTDRLPRFMAIPQRKNKRGKAFIVLDNIIRHCLPRVFRGVIDIDHAEAFTFKITMDAELELGDGINQSLINKVATSLKRRQNSDNLERFVYDQDMPADLLEMLTRRLRLDKYDSLIPGGRYHNAKDFINFPNVGPKYLEFKPLPPQPCQDIRPGDKNIFESIRERDILLYYPYNSFDAIVELLKTAAVDPAVKSIRISLYRVASKSKIVDALLSARSNDKEVTAVVELQARFDEAANIDWANQLTEGGVNVIFGIPGLKVHSKLISITRQEKSALRYYTHVGTGNFNEKTATIYTDFSLMTYDQKIGLDAEKVFDFIAYTYKQHEFSDLLISPLSNRTGLETYISNETRNALNGDPAEIFIKCNNLVDTSIISMLYEASQAGVRIRIICRGMCSLIPGIAGVSENIEVISIVDRYLEHPRVYIFHNNGNRKYFISSADLMTRNLDFRVEATAPIKDAKLQQRIQTIMDIQWCDNVKARALDQRLGNQIRKNKISAKIRSQELIHSYFHSGYIPKAVQRAQKDWQKTLDKEAFARRRKLLKNAGREAKTSK